MAPSMSRTAALRSVYHKFYPNSLGDVEDYQCRCLMKSSFPHNHAFLISFSLPFWTKGY